MKFKRTFIYFFSALQNILPDRFATVPKAFSAPGMSRKNACT